jgi:hypothetical protein
VLLFLGVVLCLGFAVELEGNHAFYAYYYRTQPQSLHVVAGIALVLAGAS